MEKTNNLIAELTVRPYKGYRIKTRISLNDECGNGPEYFAMTGTIWENRQVIACGCIHDEILEHFPHLKIFAELHLCDFSGAKLYTVEDGMYHFLKMECSEFCEYFNCTPEQWESLRNDSLEFGLNRTLFAHYIQRLGLPDQWQKKANEAIAILEQMTGKQFESTATAGHFDPKKYSHEKDI